MEEKFNWDNIKDLPELSWIPDSYDVEDKPLFRSPLLLINHLMWRQLVDYNFYNAINSSGDTVITVHAYYSASCHYLRKLETIEIPAGKPFNDVIKIRNFSPLREQSEHIARLETCLNPLNSAPLRSYLEEQHRIPDLTSYCSEDMREFELKGDGSVAPYDRIWVAWVIDLVLGLYREDMEGNVSLVGCSDYLVDFASMIYPKSNKYWVNRIKEETIVARAEFGLNDQQHFRSVYIPGTNPIMSMAEKGLNPEGRKEYFEWLENQGKPEDGDLE